MKTPLDLAAVVRVFAAAPGLASAGALAGATALHQEHLENRFGRFSFDIDLHNSKEDLETVHRRLFQSPENPLRLVSRLNEGIYEYAARVGRRVVRVELARPYLRHRERYPPSRHVPGLRVVAFPDLLLAKISAFSSRGLPRDFFDLFAAGEEREVDWDKLLLRAALSDDNDFNPVEFEHRLDEHAGSIATGEFFEELPVASPPRPPELIRCVNLLRAANHRTAQAILE